MRKTDAGKPATKGRKPVSKSDSILHNGTSYRINNKPCQGVYLEIIHKTIEQLDACLVKWRRVFVIRFDLHQRHSTDDSKMVSMFLKNLKRRIEREYRTAEVGHIWVRETETAKSQHYHVSLYLDGSKIRHSSKLIEIISDAWSKRRDGNTVGLVEKCFYNVTDETTKADAIYRLSYLGKARGKGYRDPQAKDFGASRIRA